MALLTNWQSLRVGILARVAFAVHFATGNLEHPVAGTAAIQVTRNTTFRVAAPVGIPSTLAGSVRVVITSGAGLHV